MNRSATYVYKILDKAPPGPVGIEALPDELPLSALDAQDGFIHLSNAARIPVTAGLFFNDSTSVFVLKVSTAESIKNNGELRWVEGEELAGCVHLHNGKLGRGNVVGGKEYKRKEGESWGDAIARSERDEEFLKDM